MPHKIISIKVFQMLVVTISSILHSHLTGLWYLLSGWWSLAKADCCEVKFHMFCPAFSYFPEPMRPIIPVLHSPSAKAILISFSWQLKERKYSESWGMSVSERVGGDNLHKLQQQGSSFRKQFHLRIMAKQSSNNVSISSSSGQSCTLRAVTPILLSQDILMMFYNTDSGLYQQGNKFQVLRPAMSL